MRLLQTTLCLSVEIATFYLVLSVKRAGAVPPHVPHTSAKRRRTETERLEDKLTHAFLNTTTKKLVDLDIPPWPTL